MNQEQERRIAESRVYAYNNIIGILSRLPDEEFLGLVSQDAMIEFLRVYGEMGQPSVSKGVQEILTFVRNMKATEEVIETMAVDRTRIIRAPQKGGLKPPYENQYCDKKKEGSLLGSLQRAYIKSGYIPVDAKDTADFLLIELDFMKRLIDMGEIEQQKEFMREHLGAWVCSYAQAAADTAETAFYRGWMNFLDGFIQVEKEYLK